ncbi:MAG: hypothetical protein K0S39_434 [Paenibacillus sp.]|nr:hypothetical protein [Paenibacillus sp.]
MPRNKTYGRNELRRILEKGRNRRRMGNSNLNTRLKAIGYSAFVWSVIFGLVHVYWAFGGTAGFEGRAMNDVLLIINWIAIVLSVVAAILAHAMVHAWGRRIRSWILLTLAWGAAVVLGLRGIVGISETLLNPELEIPLLVMIFEPLFLIGGILFGLMAVVYRNSINV